MRFLGVHSQSVTYLKLQKCCILDVFVKKQYDVAFRIELKMPFPIPEFELELRGQNSELQTNLMYTIAVKKK